MAEQCTGYEFYTKGNKAVRMKADRKRRKDLQTNRHFRNYQTNNQHPYRFQQYHSDNFRQHNQYRQYDQHYQSRPYQETKRNYAKPNDKLLFYLSFKYYLS